MSEGLRLSEYGGARVFRKCSIGGKVRERDEMLTAKEVNAIPRPNLHALINGHFLEPFPPPPPMPESERFVIRRSDLKFDVVQGVKLNDEPLSKAEAEAML